MLDIVYEKSGKAISDFEVEETVSQIANSPRGFFRFSNEMGIYCVRLAVVRGLIRHDEVRIYFNGETIHVDEYAKCNPNPEGFCDIDSKIMKEILHHQRRLSKE